MSFISRSLLALTIAGTASATFNFGGLDFGNIIQNAQNGNLGSASCKSTDFWWDKKSCCISKDTKITPSAPADTACPSSHWWKADSSCCAPRTPNVPEVPSCAGVQIGGKNCGWSVASQKCVRSNDDDDDDVKAAAACKGASFYWGDKRICLDVPKVAPPPPANVGCPGTHFWNSNYNACAPKGPSAPADPSCDDVKINGKGCGWNRDQLRCVPKEDTPVKPPTPTTPTPPSGPASCKPAEFWWAPKGCCLPQGGPPAPPAPPAGTKCPASWWWRNDCCVPHQPAAPQTCAPAWGWNANKQCCTPSSPSAIHRRSLQRPISRCPTGLTACSVSSLSSDFECVNVKYDHESCGGCASTGEGKNCSDIANALVVGCEVGACKVYKCNAGSKLSRDGKSCISV